MKLVKSLLLGSAAGLATVVAAQAADLPTRKAAPVEYVRVCDAYGAGFFFIPGTDTCLRVGGLVLAQFGVQPDSANYSISPPVGGAIAAIPAGLTGGIAGVVGNVPGPTTYIPIRGREIFGYNATGRIELDARTQSPFGTVRTFIRLTSQYGSSANYTTGSLQTAFGNNLANSTGGPTVSKEVTYLDKAFIQFAGITAGRVQSFFDFYADAINYASLRGSNQTAWAAAYTFTFGGGFSATAAIEDTASHRGDVANVAGGTFTTLGTVGAAGAIAAPAAGNGLTALVGQAKMPDIIGNLRWDQPWGAAQLSGAVHYIKANLFASPAVTSGQSGAPTGYAYSLNSTSQIGFAVQGGLQFNLPMLGAGDKLWLQATYARGAIGYVQGNNLAFTQGVNATSNYGRGVFRSNNSVGWTGQGDPDCVFNYTGTCDKSSAYALLAALKHYWTPTVSSGFFGSYYNVHYSSNSTTPINPFFGAGGGTAAASVGISNYQDVRVGTNLVWTPVKNFDIGAEFTYARYITQRPFGLAPDITLRSVGLPAYQGTTSQYLGSVRMIRAF